jgi:hypothetical protein
MRVEMCDVDTDCERSVDLSPQLYLEGLGDSIATHRCYVGPEESKLVSEASRARQGRERSPAIRPLLAGKRQMHTHVECTVCGSHLSRFWEPRAGHHDGARAARAKRRKLA